jgi:hypothetical protein
MSSRTGTGFGVKRCAEVPPAALRLGYHVSKADLLEAAWYLASIAHADGCDDDGATYVRLLDEINLLREHRGAPPVRIKERPTHVRKTRESE